MMRLFDRHRQAVADHGLTRPDVDGLLDAVYDEMGKGKGRKLLQGYPDLESGLKRGRWDRAWEALDDAVADGVLTADDRDRIEALADEHNIPRE